MDGASAATPAARVGSDLRIRFENSFRLRLVAAAGWIAAVVATSLFSITTTSWTLPLVVAQVVLAVAGAPRCSGCRAARR